jgi:ketosteroid isomerase-like protein
LKLARKGFERFNEGHMEGFWALQSPDVVMVTDPTWPGGGEYPSREGFKHFLEQFTEPFSSIKFESQGEDRVVGRYGILRGAWVGAGLTSGIETRSAEFSVLFTSDGNAVTEVRFFFRDEEALEYASSQT